MGENSLRQGVGGSGEIITCRGGQVESAAGPWRISLLKPVRAPLRLIRRRLAHEPGVGKIGQEIGAMLI